MTYGQIAIWRFGKSHQVHSTSHNKPFDS